MSTATHNFDTLAAAEELQAAGLKPDQARAISQIIGRSREVDPTVMENITDIKERLAKLEIGQKVLFWATGINIVLTASILLHLLSR